MHTANEIPRITPPPGVVPPWMTAVEAHLDALRMIRIVEKADACRTHGFLVDRTLLPHAVPFSWGRDAIRACLAASTSIPADAVFNEWNFAASALWWHFDEPLPIVTVMGDDTNPSAPRLGVRALCIGWMQANTERNERVIGCSVWTDNDFSDLPSRVTPTQTWVWIEGESHAEMLARSRASYHTLYGPGGRYAGKPHVGEDVFLSATEALSRFVMAGMTWLSQRVLVESAGHIERHRRKEFTRATGQDVRDVRVIALRRAQYSQADAETPEGTPSADDKVEWSCRWTVDGHFRQQPCGPQRQDRRLVWIGPYVKGPDDKPLRVSQRKVYSVRR